MGYLKALNYIIIACGAHELLEEKIWLVARVVSRGLGHCTNLQSCENDKTEMNHKFPRKDI